MRVAMIGATGLVGSLAARRLLAQGHELEALLRRPSGIVHPNWREHVAPPGEWAGIVAGFARAAARAGARRMVTVSSVGAALGSANFYLAIKGEMEAALEESGFERLDILRPGLLRGPRGGDRRLGERVGILLSPVVNLFLRGRLDRYAAIDAEIVAAAVAAALRQVEPGAYLHENREIRALARAA